MDDACNGSYIFSIEDACGNTFTVFIIIRLCGNQGSCQSEGKLKKEFFVNLGFINLCDNNFNTHSSLIILQSFPHYQASCAIWNGSIFPQEEYNNSLCFFPLSFIASFPYFFVPVVVIYGSDYNKSMKSEQFQAESGLQKFISLMKSLTQFIRDDFSHQQTIYECLNSHELRRLFDSIHDESWQLRMTAVKFIAYLLYGNRSIIEIISAMQGYDYSGQHKKYVIGGLDYYLKCGCSLRAIVGAVGKVKYQPQMIAWAIDTKTLKISYFSRDSAEQFIFDPKIYIVGIFLRPQEQERKALPDKSRYKISKR